VLTQTSPVPTVYAKPTDKLPKQTLPRWWIEQEQRQASDARLNGASMEKETFTGAKEAAASAFFKSAGPLDALKQYAQGIGSGIKVTKRMRGLDKMYRSLSKHVGPAAAGKFIREHAFVPKRRTDYKSYLKPAMITGGILGGSAMLASAIRKRRHENAIERLTRNAENAQDSQAIS